MKKFLLTLCTLFFVGSAWAQTNLSEGKEYTTLERPESAQKQVVEFFSFYCPHCYDFQTEFKIPQQIKAKLAKDITFESYHVNFLGRQSENLTRAWALAMTLGATDKVVQPLFNATRTDSIKSMDDIRKIFIDNGISASEFDGGINSFSVNTLVKKQESLVKEYNVKGVPAIFVNGKYQMNLGGFSDSTSTEDFIQRYVNAILALSQK